MDPFATVVELQERLDWTLSDGEQKVALGALEDLSEWARHYGRDGWDATNCPSMVKRLVLGAAARFMRNPEGYQTSRAGDETVDWQRSDNPGTASFNTQEQRAIWRIANPGSTGLHSLQIAAYSGGAKVDDNYVPVGDGDGEPFPFYSNGGPW